MNVTCAGRSLRDRGAGRADRVVLQLAVVAQITVFDANADLLPLVALSIGLLGGPGRRARPSASLLGLVADMALLQTLGVSSLLLIGVGYLAGRYRELRDATPQARAADRRRSSRRSAYAAGFSLVAVPARRRVLR